MNAEEIERRKAADLAHILSARRKTQCSDHRRGQCRDAGEESKSCGCPINAASGRECCALRKVKALGCLCLCHDDDLSILQRSEARRLLKGAGFQ